MGHFLQLLSAVQRDDLKPKLLEYLKQSFSSCPTDPQPESGLLYITHKQVVLDTITDVVHYCQHLQDLRKVMWHSVNEALKYISCTIDCAMGDAP